MRHHENFSINSHTKNAAQNEAFHGIEEQGLHERVMNLAYAQKAHESVAAIAQNEFSNMENNSRAEAFDSLGASVFDATNEAGERAKVDAEMVAFATEIIAQDGTQPRTAEHLAQDASPESVVTALDILAESNEMGAIEAAKELQLAHEQLGASAGFFAEKNESFRLPGLPGNETYPSEKTRTQERFSSVKVSGEEGGDTTSYNKYSIRGKEVIFRSYNEVPAVNGPARWINQDDVTPTLRSGIENSKTIVNSEREDATLVVPTSPEGIISAALEVSEGNVEVANLLDEDGKLSTSDKAKIFLDSMVASVLYDDKGKERQPGEMVEDNGDGFATLVAAMAGDSESIQTVNEKLSQYYEAIDSEKMRTEEVLARENDKSIESMPKNEILLVHSTSHDIERDDNGNVVLYSAASKREDRYPRSSVHFTANGEVQSHQQGQWNDSNKLILTNFEDAHQANGNPKRMSEVDTWYTLNPNESLALPGARIIEPSQLEDGLLLAKDGDTYRYHLSEIYTPSQVEQIEGLAQEYNVDQSSDYAKMLREVVFRMAGEELGVKEYIRIGEHSGDNQEFNEKYKSLANEMGVLRGSHDNAQEGDVESKFIPSTQASLEANRTLAWSGTLTTRTSLKRAPSFSPPAFGGGLI